MPRADRVVGGQRSGQAADRGLAGQVQRIAGLAPRVGGGGGENGGGARA
jgi:hypothetical protein